MWRFYLTDDSETNFYYVDSTGTVQTTTTPTYLKNVPKGWEKLEIKWQRHSKYLGLIRSLAPVTEFILDGRTIIRYIYYNQGVEGICKVKIDRQSDFDYSWSTLWKGRCDLYTFQDNEFSVNCNLIEGGLADFVAANGNKKYQFNLADNTDGQTKSLIISGTDIVEPLKWYPVYTFVQVGVDHGYGWLIPDTSPVEAVSDVKIGTQKGQLQGVLLNALSGQSIQNEFTGNFFYQANLDQTFKFTIVQLINFYFTSTNPWPSFTLLVKLLVVNLANQIVNSIIIGTFTVNDQGGHTVTLDNRSTPANFSMAQNDRLYICYGWNGNNTVVVTDTVSITINDNGAADHTWLYYHTLEVHTTGPSKAIPGYSYFTAYNKLLAQVSLQTIGNHSSDFFDSTKNSAVTYNSYPPYGFLTCGAALRNFWNVAAQNLVLSFDDLFERGGYLADVTVA